MGAVSRPKPEPRGVEFLQARRVRFVEEDAPPVPGEHAEARDRVWEEAVLANPALFDGPVAALAGWSWERPGELVVRWARVTYRHHALRRVPRAAFLPSIFVCTIQPSTARGVRVGRMGAATASPGRWQLPGGAVDSPDENTPLTLPVIAGHAARELREETGIRTAPDELELWAVVRVEHGSIGIVFTATPRPARFIQDAYAEMSHAETAAGRDPELQVITFVRTPADVAALTGPTVDFLLPLITRYSSSARSAARFGRA